MTEIALWHDPSDRATPKTVVIIEELMGGQRLMIEHNGEARIIVPADQIERIGEQEATDETL